MFKSENWKGRDNLGELSVDGRTDLISSFIIEKKKAKMWNGFTWVRLAPVGLVLKLLVSRKIS
jgi:hypothetical protein